MTKRMNMKTAATTPLFERRSSRVLCENKPVFDGELPIDDDGNLLNKKGPDYDTRASEGYEGIDINEAVYYWSMEISTATIIDAVRKLRDPVAFAKNGGDENACAMLEAMNSALLLAASIARHLEQYEREPRAKRTKKNRCPTFGRTHRFDDNGYCDCGMSR